jgi:hypothetical protein
VKRIGFIDFFLDEWHANNYPLWIRENSARHGRDMELSYAWAESDKAGGLDSDAWCLKQGVIRIASLTELVDKSDFVVILSPDNPEYHEKLAALALESGKPVYIDKTFSPDLASGSRLFELARKHGTPVFSSSALRFAEELAALPRDRISGRSIEYLATTGPGSFDHYSVHQIENIVALMGTGARRVKSLSADHGRLLVVEFADGRLAAMHQMNALPFQLAIQLRDGTGFFVAQCSQVFERLIDSMLDFFASRRSPVPEAETLSIMAIIEAGRTALKTNDQWVRVPE